MKAVKITLYLLIATLFTSCVYHDEDHYGYYDSMSLEEVLYSNEIWYVDYNRTQGNANVPFLSKAFTLSFDHGKIYANNNLAGIGDTGNGFGVFIGYYDTVNGLLEIDHNNDGYYDFDVRVQNNHEIRLRDRYNGAVYYLEGYSRTTFDYNKVFYDNIELFLEEYLTWTKTFTSLEGSLNDFDNENHVQFTADGIFRSSQDDSNISINSIIWDFTGSYEIFDVNGYDDVKIIKMDYDFFTDEEFELTLINDAAIRLYHVSSDTTYEFSGRGFIQYFKSSKTKGKDKKIRQPKKRKTKERQLRSI